ncbi:DUF3558 family protein [Pseudonocardia sp. C8]|nr:DUF3558 family protein [Pseudonocardia sp. C8]
MLLALVVGGAALAGCGGGEPASPFPPRPTTVDVDRLDPCAVVTESQRRTLGLSHGRPPTITLTPTGSRGCGWSDFAGGYNYTVQTLPTGAIESAGADQTRLTQVSGFGAVEATSFGPSASIRAAGLSAPPVTTGQGRQRQAQVTELVRVDHPVHRLHRGVLGKH